ncbi:DUF2147 domain-containing protein [Helicobacter himalayensis]|uniref:DUF2147 domain-containing protein n=1 Tax=Helicobacter himalayensis TaxID=1591088 RepID=UPI003D7010D3
MKSLKNGFFLLLGALAFCFSQDLLSGFYKTHIGKSGRQSIVEFFQKDGKYYAYGFANVDGTPPAKDIHNKNPNLRERYDNVTIFVYGLEGDSDTYKNGKVYNYDSGEIYYAKITLEGKNLTLRASVDSAGVLGETKIWSRLSDEELKPYLSKKPPMQEVLKSLKDWEQ